MSAAADSDGDGKPAIQSLDDLTERLKSLEGRERINLGDVVDALGKQSLAPLLLVPGLLVVSPLSGIPGLSSLGGLTIALIALQLMLSRGEGVWLPGFLRRRGLSGESYGRALGFVEPALRWLGRHLRPRLRWLTRRPLVLVPEAICLVSGLTMPLLEVLPLTSTLLAAGVSLLALAILTRDGLLMLLALVPYGVFGTLLYQVMT